MLVVATFAILRPFAPWILLAIWASALLRPTHAWLSRHLGRRERLAALATTLGLLVVVARAVVCDHAASGNVAELALSQGARAWAIAQHVAGTAAHVVIVGILGAGFAQAVVATAFYLALDIPQPIVLGFIERVAHGVGHRSKSSQPSRIAHAAKLGRNEGLDIDGMRAVARRAASKRCRAWRMTRPRAPNRAIGKSIVTPTGMPPSRPRLSAG